MLGLSLGSTDHHIPEAHNLNIHCHRNIKYYAATPRVKMADGLENQGGGPGSFPRLKSYAGQSPLISTVLKPVSMSDPGI